VDLYMWFKWKDPDIDPSRSFEFMNAFELWGHILTYETEEPEKLPDGSLHELRTITVLLHRGRADHGALVDVTDGAARRISY
jgi:hypothetical protein